MASVRHSRMTVSKNLNDDASFAVPVLKKFRTLDLTYGK
jgi:hypothetical protein